MTDNQYQQVKEIIGFVEQQIAYYKSMGLESVSIDSKILKGNEYFLSTLKQEINDCRACKLCVSRQHNIFGEGNPDADLVFLGGPPGDEEDSQGRPFTGEAEQLLGKIIKAIGLSRSDVFITNIIKCRLPSAIEPNAEEVQACSSILSRQLKIIKPKIICVLGNFPARALLSSNKDISELRGKFYDFQEISVMPTFSPSHLLKHPNHKKLAWIDLQEIQRKLTDLCK